MNFTTTKHIHFASHTNQIDSQKHTNIQTLAPKTKAGNTIDKFLSQQLVTPL